MKQLHFVLIAKHLTGDSEVQFFETRKEAVRCFKGLTKPLLDICVKNELEEDEAFSFGQERDCVRFDSGYDEDLDKALGECNHYYRLGMVEVNEDVTHYVADFSEWVDESVIDFFTEEKAKEVWNDKIDEEIALASQYQGVEISRYHQDTWEDKSGMTLYQETHYSDMYSDAYFGHSTDMTWTFRIGKIIFN
jgi:hypothetical protein